MKYSAAHHETWEHRQLDAYLEGGGEGEENPTAPVYFIERVAKETKTGRILNDDECEDIYQAWVDKLSTDEIRASERQTEYLVLTGVLK